MSSPFDPDAPEDRKRPGGTYVSKADLKWLLIAVPLVAIGFFPIYQNMVNDGKKKICSTNIQLIGKAIQAYAVANEDRFPPIYMAGDLGNPALHGPTGVPINWMTNVEPYLNKRGDTICPAATKEENSQFYSPERKGPRELSYGMYFPLEARPIYQLSNPSTLILITETSSDGANGTYNPQRLEKSGGGVLRDDGFLIGFDNEEGNFGPSASTKHVTRLAFSNTKDGNFDNPASRGRHGTNHVIFADGSGGSLTPGDARVRMLNDEPTGRWRAR